MLIFFLSNYKENKWISFNLGWMFGFGYFISKKTALKAIKLLKKKYRNYWCILSKTI